MAEELAVVEYIKSLKRKRLSLRQIARRLNEKEILTKRGGSWYACTVRYILLNAKYKKVKEAIGV